MSAIPLADTSDLARLTRRTTIVRLVLLAAIAAVAAACVASVGRLDVAETTVLGPGTSGVIVLDLSSSTESAPPRDIPGLLRHLANAGGRTGLVLFSDVAYEALPLGTSSEELRPFLRYFRRPPAPAVPASAATPPPVRPLTPWSRSFRSGTRISGRARGRAEDGARGTVGGHTRRGARQRSQRFPVRYRVAREGDPHATAMRGSGCGSFPCVPPRTPGRSSPAGLAQRHSCRGRLTPTASAAAPSGR